MTLAPPQIRNVVITRSKEGNVALARELRRRGFTPIPVDTISFHPPRDWSAIDKSLKALGHYDWLMFTSVTGVESFVQRMKKLSLGLPWAGPPKVAAVGKGTAGALARLGVATAFTPSSYLTEKLADELPEAPGKKVLILRADVGDPALVQRMDRRGFEVTEFPIYRTRPVRGVEDKRLDDADLIIFGSPSAVEGFSKKTKLGKSDKLIDTLVACIGPVTAAAARENGFRRIITPKSHTFDSLLQEIVELNHHD